MKPRKNFSFSRAGLVILSLGLILLVSFAPPGSAATSAFQFTTLQPGGFRNIEQNLPINIVFVGYEPGAGAQQINEVSIHTELSNTYRALNRFPAFYGIRNFVGVTFNYDYNLVYADTTFENAFFGYLSSIAQARPRTFYQNLYNAQNANALDVGQNHWIDAPSVEKWLANNAGAMLDINPAQYTIFFINWYGRTDFKFHVYTKTDEPDTDTGFNHGLIRASRKMIAWGGTTPDDEESGLGSLRRIWFYDLSAGPEAWTNNWNVDNADLDGDGVLDYRMPPVWEYGNLSGYRPFNNLSGDLGKITRYVALDLLFTSSPLYKPAISPPKLPTDLQLDVNLYQADLAANARDFLNPTLLRQEVNELQPLNSISTEVNDLSFSGRAADIYNCFRSAALPPFVGESCYGNRLFGIAFADLFLYHQDHLLQFLEGNGDYKVPIFVYNTTAEQSPGGLLGFADDNWTDGTQSFVFVFDDPSSRSLGFGITDTTIHEVGHHLGMSHPHDGYDFEANVDFFQSGAFYYAWSGDESNTVMNYLAINSDFSQFDRDNMNRFLTATYINQTNSILPQILSSPRAGAVSNLLAAADGQATSALSAYANMNYANAAALSKAVYQSVLNAAAQINIVIEPQAWQADYRAKGRSSKFIDNVQDYRLDVP